MKIPEHIALSYLLAQLEVQQQYGSTGTAFMIVAGCLSDIDGVTILGGWQCYRKYHRRLGHGLPMTCFGAAFLAVVYNAIFRNGPIVTIWFWLQVSLMAHLYTDACFYRWPIQLLWPVSTAGWEAGLLHWNDLCPTIILYLSCVVIVVWPGAAQNAAMVGICFLAQYLIWRIWHPQPLTNGGVWLAGAWARRSPRICRWLTGDFVT